MAGLCAGMDATLFTRGIGLGGAARTSLRYSFLSPLTLIRLKRTASVDRRWRGLVSAAIAERKRRMGGAHADTRGVPAHVRVLVCM